MRRLFSRRRKRLLLRRRRGDLDVLFLLALARAIDTSSVNGRFAIAARALALDRLLDY